MVGRQRGEGSLVVPALAIIAESGRRRNRRGPAPHLRRPSGGPTVLATPSRIPLAALTAWFLLAAPAWAGAADYVWIEAESLAQPPAGFKAAGWGNKHYLSGERW